MLELNFNSYHPIPDLLLDTIVLIHIIGISIFNCFLRIAAFQKRERRIELSKTIKDMESRYANHKRRFIAIEATKLDLITDMDLLPLFII